MSGGKNKNGPYETPSAQAYQADLQVASPKHPQPAAAAQVFSERTSLCVVAFNDNKHVGRSIVASTQSRVESLCAFGKKRTSQ